MFRIVFSLCLTAVLLLTGGAAAQQVSTAPAPPPRLGFVLVAWDDQFNADPRAWERGVDALFAAGVRDMTVVTYRFADKRTGKITPRSAYRLESPPTNAVLLAALKRGAELGMRTSLSPLVEIDNHEDLGGEWRGELDFTGPALEAFAADYRAYLRNMAELVKAAGGYRLYVGSEMQALATNRAARPLWDAVIQDARQTLPNGVKLSYAANYDSAGDIPFWDQLDEIGVDAYYELTSRAEAAGRGNPPVDVIKQRWQGPLAQLRKLSQRHGKPVVFSEWGVVPFDLTTVRPWDWQPTKRRDLQEQVNAYQATLEAIASEGEWLKAVTFWHWALPGNEGSHYRITDTSPVMRLIQSAAEPR